MKIEISNGRVIDPEQGIDRKTSLYVAAGKIAAVGAPPRRLAARPRASTRPGSSSVPDLIDASARLREPGFEYKATLESEVAAAVAGGVTRLACPPDTDPPLDEPGLVEMLKHRARALNLAHVYPIGALTVGLEGRHDNRNGRAHRRRLYRVLARRCRARRHPSHAARAAIRGDLRLPCVAAAAGCPSRPRRRRARRRGCDAAGLAGDSGFRRNDRARDDLRAGARDRRARASGAAVDP